MKKINPLTEQPDNVKSCSSAWGKSQDRDVMHGPLGFNSHGKHIRALREQQFDRKFEDEPQDAVLPVCDLYCEALKELNA